MEQIRQRNLHRLGIFCGLSAALWLAGAEAPTKLVAVAVSPLVISFMMVLGAFVSRWSLPALVRGTGDIFADARYVPHLIVWGGHGWVPLGSWKYADHICGEGYRAEPCF